MSNPFNGSKHGKRGQNSKRPSTNPQNRETHDRSHAEIINEGAKYNECYTSQVIYDPTLDNGIDDISGLVDLEVRDKSLTQIQQLKHHRSEVTEAVDLKWKQAEKIDGKLTGRMIEGTDRKVLKMTSQSLLNQGKPFQMPKDRNSWKRITSKSKRRKYDEDAVFTPKRRP